jgi:hypothetical protein
MKAHHLLLGCLLRFEVERGEFAQVGIPGIQRGLWIPKLEGSTRADRKRSAADPGAAAQNRGKPEPPRIANLDFGHEAVDPAKPDVILVGIRAFLRDSATATIGLEFQELAAIESDETRVRFMNADQHSSQTCPSGERGASEGWQYHPPI